MAMSSGIGATWSGLLKEVAYVHWQWNMFCQLFGKSPERLDLLNQCAAQFFAVIQRTMLADIQLTLSKLGDPAKTQGRFPNATLEKLLEEIQAVEEQSAFVVRLKTHLRKYRADCERMRKRRNKYLAHFDYDTVVESVCACVTGCNAERDLRRTHAS